MTPSDDLNAALQELVPRAIAWAEQEATRVAQSGAALTEQGQELARRVGVRNPERIRVLIVDALPLPDEPALRAAALEVGMLGPDMTGLTLGHSVFIRQGYGTRELLSHEFRHVHQYEEAGSIAAFLPRYLAQVVQLGYTDAPLEQDARAYEID